MLGFVVYAEDEVESENSTLNQENNRQKNNNEIKKEENKKLKEIKKEEFKNEIEEIKDDFETKREERKNNFELMVQSVKEKREEFKTELENKKEEAGIKIIEMKAKFKEEIKLVKDETKKIATENIIDNVQSLNIKFTNNLSDKINQIENVLISIESRIAKAETNGIDVTLIKTSIEKAKEAITLARNSVSIQTNKVYDVNITGETTLKTEMKNLRELFKKDIKSLNEQVKLAHVAVKNTAEALAQIPKIDQEEITVNNDPNNQVEDNNITNNNE